ncbi:MAG: SET domain-containing protein-lysine N-methyltransferase [Planctomycetes bacterium]|nr:SET domain-containing protein-lysine N-methyltransferase [Planctomycetota bacterium]
MTDVRLTARPSLQAQVRVERRDDALCVVARSTVAPGDPLLRIEGRIVTRPARHTVQVGKDEHVAGDTGLDLEQQIERFPWRFLNHSCAPNAALRGRELIALRAIAAGEEVTFDYHTTEWELATPFACHCGADCCVGVVRGYRHLDAQARCRLDATVAPHLLALAACDAAPGPSR